MGTVTPPVVDASADADLIAHAVDALTRHTRFPVAFGGMLHEGAVRISAVAGARTRHLDALVVEQGRGLGGRSVLESRPRLALDYRTARSITHDYDAMVLGEGIATLFAVPIMTGGTARGVLYCGSWGQAPVADHVARPAVRIADEVGIELRVRDEVARRLARVDAPAPTRPPAAVQEELRVAYAQLRHATARVRDADARGELGRVQARLAALSSPPEPVPLDRPLSPREIDVLSCAALGHTNAQIARSLDLKEATVKSYLAAAMTKLDASTRHSAVARARRAGLLP